MCHPLHQTFQNGSPSSAFLARVPATIAAAAAATYTDRKICACRPADVHLLVVRRPLRHPAVRAARREAQASAAPPVADVAACAEVAADQVAAAAAQPGGRRRLRNPARRHRESDHAPDGPKATKQPRALAATPLAATPLATCRPGPCRPGDARCRWRRTSAHAGWCLHPRARQALCCCSRICRAGGRWRLPIRKWTLCSPPHTGLHPDFITFITFATKHALCAGGLASAGAQDRAVSLANGHAAAHTEAHTAALSTAHPAATPRRAVPRI